MKRLIDAEVLCNALRIMAGTGAEPDSWEDGYDRGIDVALRFVETAPTVDATPVIHAHWIFNRGRCSCSHCGGITECPLYYCPKCGAKVDGHGVRYDD